MNSVVEGQAAISEQALSILEKVKALSAGEQEAFVKLFHDWETKSNGTQQPTEESQWPDFAGRAKAIFGERVIPGDPQQFWDEERGR